MFLILFHITCHNILKCFCVSFYLFFYFIKCRLYGDSNFNGEIIFHDIVNPNNRSNPTSIYLVGVCGETLENNHKFRFRHILSYVITERICTTSFPFIFGQNNIFHHHSAAVNHFLLQMNIDLVRSGCLYSISLGDGKVQYFPVGIMINKCPYIYSTFHFKIFTRGDKIAFWNVTMENPLQFVTLKFFNYHFTLEWLDISLQNEFNISSYQYLPAQTRYKKVHPNTSIIKYIQIYLIFNYLFIFLFSILRLSKIKISKKLKFCRFIYSHNYISFIMSIGIQLFFTFIVFFIVSQFFNKSSNLTKMSIHFFIILLMTSPLNGYSSYRLFIGSLNHFMLLQFCLWFFELGFISLIYCIICVSKINYYNADRELLIIIYIIALSFSSLIGSSLSHPLIIFIDNTKNQKKDNDQTNDQKDQAPKKIDFGGDDVDEEIIDSIEKLKELNYESDSDDYSETPFINHHQLDNNINSSFNNPKSEIIKNNNRIRIPFSLRPWVRCIFNSFLIAIIFSAGFFFLIQSLLFNNNTKLTYIFILFDLLSTLSFSVYINSYQIRKQIKCGDTNSSLLFLSTILSGAFLFIFSLIFYERIKDENLLLSFKLYISLSSFFCISLSLIFSSLTFMIIFIMFIHQHKRQNNYVYQST